MKVSNTWNYRFKTSIGKFICLSCKAAINKLKESVNFDDNSVKSYEFQKVDSSEIQSDNISLDDDDVHLDPTFVCTRVDDELKKRKLSTFLGDNGQTPIKKRLSKLSKNERREIQETVNSITSGLLSKSNSSSNASNLINESWITNLKEELSKKILEMKKYQF